jgi:hypothetical protein
MGLSNTHNTNHVEHQSWKSQMEQLEASLSETYERTAVKKI